MDVTDADGADWPPELKVPESVAGAAWPASPWDGEVMTEPDVLAMRRLVRSDRADRPEPQGSLGAGSGGTDDKWTLLHPVHCRDDRCNGGATCGCPCHLGVPMPDPYEASKVLVAKRTDGQAVPPFMPPKYQGDCGLDLALSQDVVIAPGATVNAPCGVAVALPAGTFGWITGRSSTWSRHGLMVIPGVIDEGWRGELRVLAYRPAGVHANYCKPGGACICTASQDLKLEKGTRLAQLIVLPNLLPSLPLHFVGPDIALPDSERGTNGFGSSGD